MQWLPPVDLRIFDRPVKQTPYVKYISIDVLLLVGSSSKALTMPCDTFYSSDLLCIVLRSKHGGVVDTDLILWRGKHNLAGEAEENKVKELESRYRTGAKEVKQGCEDESLVRALGGRLVIRQGSRSTFDILNTTMYRVQSPSRGVVFVDEVELVRGTLFRPRLLDRQADSKFISARYIVMLSFLVRSFSLRRAVRLARERQQSIREGSRAGVCFRIGSQLTTSDRYGGRT